MNLTKLTAEDILELMHSLMNEYGEEVVGTMFQMALAERNEVKQDHIEGDLAFQEKDTSF